MQLSQAIQSFPKAQWLSNHTAISDTGGQNFYADCPFCLQKRKLGVDRVKGVFHCFYCYEGGHADQSIWTGACDLVKMVSLLEHISMGKAIHFIYNYVGMDTPIVKQEIPKQLIPEEAIPLRSVDAYHRSVCFLGTRGLGHLLANVYVAVREKYQGRLILPAYWLGETVGFEAKTYTGQSPKALYPTWFHTSDYIYTTLSWDDSDSVIITESIFDAETFGTNAIGLYGSSLKEGQLSRLLELKALGINKLIWALDWDAWKKQARYLLANTSGIFNNYVVNIPERKDPNSLGREGCMDLLDTAMPANTELQLIEAAQTFQREIFDFV